MAIYLSDEMQVIIELKNGQPVELLDFANSMIGFGNQYSHYLRSLGVESGVPDAKLYIKQIREGSIIAIQSSKFQGSIVTTPLKSLEPSGRCSAHSSDVY